MYLILIEIWSQLRKLLVKVSFISMIFFYFFSKWDGPIGTSSIPMLSGSIKKNIFGVRNHEKIDNWFFFSQSLGKMRNNFLRTHLEHIFKFLRYTLAFSLVNDEIFVLLLKHIYWNKTNQKKNFQQFFFIIIALLMYFSLLKHLLQNSWKQNMNSHLQEKDN